MGSVVFLVLAPGSVAVLVPWWISEWRLAEPLLGLSFLRGVGVLLIAAGAPILLDSFARFAIQGLGTPAPIMPTRHLVITGLYRHVRNPIYVAVLALILGQALLFSSVGLLLYGAVVWVAVYAFVRVYEEPTLRKSFGREYEDYCANVPPWIPRLRPWRRAEKSD